MKLGGKFFGGRFAHSGRTARAVDPAAAYAINGIHPAFVADFQTGVYQSASGAGIATVVNVSRGTAGSYTNAAGVLSWAAADEPRLDHRREDGQWISSGMLLESQARTNLFSRSAGFEQPAWSKSRASVVAGDSPAPDGTTTAARLISTTGTFDGSVRQSASYVTGQILSFSVYAKAGDRDFVFLRERTHGFPKDTYFDLSLGVPGSVNSVHRAEMLDAGGGWYRCSITVEAAQTAATDFEIYNSEEDLNTASAQPGFTRIWGAQLEVGAAPSSYIETADVPVTRAPDRVTIEPPHLIDPSSSGALSLAVAGDGQFPEGTGRTRLLNWAGDAANQITLAIERNAQGQGHAKLTQLVGGTAFDLLSSPGQYGPGPAVPFALMTRHTGSEHELSGAGSGTVPGLPALGQQALEIGPDLMGHIAILRLWDADIGALDP